MKSVSSALTTPESGQRVRAPERSAQFLLPNEAGSDTSSMSVQKLYLDLIKRSLTFVLYGLEDEYVPVVVPPNPAKRLVFNLFKRRGIELVRPKPKQPQVRIEGKDWPLPKYALTAIGITGLENLQFCVEDVLRKQVPGDLIETGAWRGGASVFMRALLKAYGAMDRIVYVADSFQGLPKPDPEKYPADAGDPHHTFDFLAVSLEEVRDAFSRYGLLDDQVHFVKGWFRDTLPHLRDKTWAVVRLDGDMYESTWDGLANLYPNLSVGGYLIVDDYGAVKGCREAVEDYRRANGIDEAIRTVDWGRVFWQRES